MIEHTLAKRYASALLAIAVKEGTVEETETNLLALKQVYQSNEAFRKTLLQPKLPRAVRKQLFRKPFEGRTSASFLEFLGLLIDKHRITLLPDIADAFDRLADASQGIVRVKVRPFKAMLPEAKSQLLSILSKLTGKKVDVEEQVDPAVKGGLLIQIGDTVIDGTVAHRLKQLRERLMNVRGLA